MIQEKLLGRLIRARLNMRLSRLKQKLQLLQQQLVLVLAVVGLAWKINGTMIMKSTGSVIGTMVNGLEQTKEHIIGQF